MQKLSRFIRVAGILTLGLVAAPSFARSDTPGVTQPSEESSAGGMHGAGRLIERALEELQLRPDQKEAIDAMKAQAAERHAPVKAARRALATAIADQLEKGDLDRCALAQKVDALASAAGQAHPGDRADFERLHSILDSQQRKAFVDALKRQWESMEKMHEPSALADKIAKKLSLSPEQRTRLEKVLTGLREIRRAEPWYAAHRERWTKILDAFEGDHFVLDDVAPMGDATAHAKARVERHLWAGEAIFPVFTPDQRKLLAEKIRGWVNEAGSEHGSEHGSVSPSMNPSGEEGE
jgi:hypothetical protein